MKNHEKGNHCKTLDKAVEKECSFQKKKLIEIYKINDNASVEDSNFLEKVKGGPKFNTAENRFDWEELPLFEYKYIY